MAEHFAEEHEFRIRCCCGRVFSEVTEARARDRFEMHRIMSGEAGSGNAPTPATTGAAGTVLPPPTPSAAGAPPPPIVAEARCAGHVRGAGYSHFGLAKNCPTCSLNPALDGTPEDAQ